MYVFCCYSFFQVHFHLCRIRKVYIHCFISLVDFIICLNIDLMANVRDIVTSPFISLNSHKPIDSEYICAFFVQNKIIMKSQMNETMVSQTNSSIVGLMQIQFESHYTHFTHIIHVMREENSCNFL